MALTNLFDYKDCFSEIRNVGVITIKEDYDENFPFTIAIPTYKRKDGLRIALESVKKQIGEVRFNVLVVDNNPERKDETEMLISSMSVPFLSYYKNEQNIGMAGNFNRLYELCKTEYLIMLHDDDCLCANLMLFVKHAVELNPSISVLNVNKLIWNGNESEASFPLVPYNHLRLVRMCPATNFYGYFFQQTSACLFKVKDVFEVGGFDTTAYPSHDYVFIEKLILAGKEVFWSKNKLVYYNTGDGTASAKLETQMLFLRNDVRIKLDLGRKLKLPKAYVRIVLSLVLRARLRRINDTYPDVTFMGIRKANAFVFFIKRFLTIAFKCYYRML